MADTPYEGDSIWWRIVTMILFALLYSVAEVVLFAVIILQAGFVLFTGDRNERLLNLGGSLGAYIYQVIAFLTFRRETRPFPFTEWPDPEDVRAIEGTGTGAD